jgi:hypothetical protein
MRRIIMNKEAKNVYIITQGCYSDYHIVTVFDDEDKAKAFVEAYNKRKRSEYEDDYCVETYKINGIDIRSYKEKIFFYAHTNYRGSLYVDPVPECDQERVGIVDVTHYPTWSSYTVTVLAENIDKARKIAADKIAEHKANKEAIT